ncbi:MAG: putative thymidylate kinase [Methanomassiliicoccales archaeon PtaU1.Bin124]|nr:MAG: putative thymidylate kinase [Methanomassiliicoccales archaeon PtaU1.Bin124]
MKGRFIVFEGIDGTGKSTVAKLVAERLRKKGIDCVLTMEPSDSWLGEAVRRANSDGTDDLAEALLFMADRAEHTRQIEKLLAEGKWVVCDRYYASTLAYQTATLGDRLEDPMNWLWNINQRIIRVPDVTYYFVLEVEKALDRMSDRNGRSKFEKLDFLRQVDENYRKVEAIDPSFHRVDADQPLDDVLTYVMNHIVQNL